MCSECGMTPCHHMCPNAEVKPVFKCCECGSELYIDDKCIKVDSDVYCMDCFIKKSLKEVCNLTQLDFGEIIEGFLEDFYHEITDDDYDEMMSRSIYEREDYEYEQFRERQIESMRT